MALWPVSAAVMRSWCLAAATWRTTSASHLVEQRLAVGDQQAGGERVVLGLREQVGGEVDRVSRRVGEDRDLRRAGLGVDADHAAHQPLGRRDVDVARAR